MAHVETENGFDMDTDKDTRKSIDDSGMIPHDRDEMYALDALLLSLIGRSTLAHGHVARGEGVLLHSAFVTRCGRGERSRS